MSRYARRRDPAVRPKKKVELQEGNITLRLLCVGVAIVVAALAFGAVINGLVSTQTGWQEIEPANPETGIAQDFLLCYNIGQSDQAASAELKAVSAHYSEALDHAYRVLSNVEQEPYVNLYTLNRQPNTDITVDPLLYEAFSQVEASGSRLPYFAPLTEQYFSLFACTYDEEAEKFDPARSEEVAQFAQEIAAFANDPEAVQVKLLPDCQLRLEVSEEYLAYARENGLESFVDFGFLLNAFLCDAVADTLEEQGYVNGYLASFDGYTRALCSEEFGLNVFDRVEGQTRQLGTVLYDGPAAIVSCRSFPILDKDSVIYYTYSDGTVLAPYLNEQGRLHTAAASLSTLSKSDSVAALALRTLAAYAGEDSTFSALDEVSWVSGANQQIALHGTDFQFAE
ncbi:MAG: hypothetical protein ACI3XG_10755 [Faecousia sp.]